MNADELTNLIIITTAVIVVSALSAGYLEDRVITVRQAMRRFHHGPDIIARFTQGPEPQSGVVYPPLPAQPPVRRETRRP
ncbi:hypothetical protein [Streptomyces sp. NPDC056987]|uniref:hypothetical protein n=1 Tax=Streptomyces sp. NPDC056987 TaxID=3345988 RepID=UPI0036301890